MSDFRLKVFHSVAKHLSFTKAANELFITQPAVTRHIRELETAYDLRLFDRRGNKIFLTPAGRTLLKYSGKISAVYNELEFELSSLKNKFSGTLHLGASTTIAQYVIPAVLASFYNRFPEIRLSLLTANTEKIEQQLQQGEIDLGIVEGKSHSGDLKYSPFLTDQLVAVTHAKSRFSGMQAIPAEQLVKIPLVLRERGSGTLEVIEHAFNKAKIKPAGLNVLIHLGSTEAIKSFLSYTDCIGFVSVRAIEKELASGELKLIAIKNFSIKRQFAFVHLKGRPSGLAVIFMKFARRHYNQK